MANPTRLITIDSRGPIPQKSGIYGPISRPYNEDVRVISRMIVGRIQVTEHLENGETRKLTIKDIPELTAEAPKVLSQNRVVQAERTALQQLVEEKKQEHLATKQEELEAAKKEIEDAEAPVKEEVQEKEVTEEPAQEESAVQRSALSKKERRALAAKEATAQVEAE